MIRVFLINLTFITKGKGNIRNGMITRVLATYRFLWQEKGERRASKQVNNDKMNDETK